MARKRKSKRKYSTGAGHDVEKEMRAYKRGKARSGPGGKGGMVKSRKQAIAIGLSKARKKGKRLPKKLPAWDRTRRYLALLFNIPPVAASSSVRGV